MLKMPQQEYSKFLRESEGLSVSDIANQVGIHWRTAKRYADRTNWNTTLGKRKSNSPVMGPIHGDCGYVAGGGSTPSSQAAAHGSSYLSAFEGRACFSRRTANGSVLREAAEGQNGFGTGENV